MERLRHRLLAMFAMRPGEAVRASLCCAYLFLAAAVALKGSDGTFKHSLDRACRELLYLPVPSTIEIHAKSTIDTVMDRLGDGSAGVLQLIVITWLRAGVVGSLLVSGVGLVLWVLLALRLKRRYVQELRTALRESAGGVPAAVEQDREADVRQVLEQTLKSGGERDRVAALEWAAQRPGLLPEERVLDCLRSDPAPAVRRAALTVVLGDDSGELPEELAEGLEAEGHQALVSVIELLVEPDPARTHRQLEQLLDGLGDSSRLPVIALLVRRLGPEFEAFAGRFVDALIGPQAPPVHRQAAARTLGLIPPTSSLQRWLPSLLEDADPRVAAAAAESAAAQGRADLLGGVVALLGRPRARAGARRSLREFGVAAVPELAAALRDSGARPALRAQTPALLGEVGSPQAVEALTAGLADPDPAVRNASLSALYRLRKRFPRRVRVSRDEHRDRVLEALGLHELLGSAWRTLDPVLGDSTPGLHLSDALDSARRNSFERILRLLALHYPVGDIERVAHNLREGSTVQRANAVELLDNILPSQLRRRALAVVEVDRGHRPARDSPGARLSVQRAQRWSERSRCARWRRSRRCPSISWRMSHPRRARNGSRRDSCCSRKATRPGGCTRSWKARWHSTGQAPHWVPSMRARLSARGRCSRITRGGPRRVP